MKLIIAGSRSFNNYDKLEKEVLKFLKQHKRKGEEVQIISGHARGADRLGERFADKFGLKKIIMPAEWEKYGQSAGFIRNKKMVKAGTHCLCFWNGISSGMIDLVANLSHEVIRVD